MTAPLSMELRKRLVRAVEQGSSAREAARHFDVSPSAAIKLVSRVRGQAARHRRSSAAVAKRCWTAMKACCVSLCSQAWHHAERDPGDADATRYRRWFAHHDLVDTAPPGALTQKKILRAAEQDRPDVAIRRKFWRVWQRFMDPASFVFLDGREQAPPVRASRPTGRRPTWSGATAGRPKTSAWSMQHRTGTGTRQPLSRACAAVASSRRSCLTGR